MPLLFLRFLYAAETVSNLVMNCLKRTGLYRLAPLFELDFSHSSFSDNSISLFPFTDDWQVFNEPIRTTLNRETIHIPCLFQSFFFFSEIQLV